MNDDEELSDGDDEILATIRLLTGRDILVFPTDEQVVEDEDLPEAEEIPDGGE